MEQSGTPLRDTLGDISHRGLGGVMRAKALVNGPGYSILRAFIGEMEAARLAGMMAAKKEQIASAPAATLSAKGSHEEIGRASCRERV